MWLCALDQGFLGDFLAEQSSVSGLLWSFSAAPQCQQLSTRAETSGWKGINISVEICSSLLKTSTKVPLLWLVEWARGEEDYCMYWAHDPWPQLGILRTGRLFGFIFSKIVWVFKLYLLSFCGDFHSFVCIVQISFIVFILCRVNIFLFSHNLQLRLTPSLNWIIK